MSDNRDEKRGNATMVMPRLTGVDSRPSAPRGVVPAPDGATPRVWRRTGTLPEGKPLELRRTLVETPALRPEQIAEALAAEQAAAAHATDEDSDPSEE